MEVVIQINRHIDVIFGTEFNDETTVFQRINRGLDLDTGSNDTRSQGVPFNYDELNNTQRSGPGTFAGGLTDYLVFTFIDESNGDIGLYHGNRSKTEVTFDPFKLAGPGWDNSNNLQPSSRFEYDYESYLKVWKNIQNSSGETNTAIYSVPDNLDSDFAFQIHNVAAVEGSTITATEFENKYGESITDVGIQNLNFSALTYSNEYSALTNTDTYTYYLTSEDQNGAGLKNFGFYTDPTLEYWDQNTYLVQIGTNVDYLKKMVSSIWGLYDLRQYQQSHLL